MRVRIINIGRVRQEFVKMGEGEYLKRIGSELKVTVEELGASSPESMAPKEVMSKEAKLLLAKIASDAFVVALDETGKTVDSKGFANLLRDRMTHGTKEAVFVIGGAFGLDRSIRDRADAVLSLSKLTFPHQLARLILVEQLYRAYALMKNVPYGK